MNQFDYKNALYTVSRHPGFGLDIALRLWKSKYETFKHFKRDIITHDILNEFSDYVSEIWDDIKPVTAEEALKIQNLEERRVYFNCIGPSKLFKQLEPKLLDKKVVNKKRTRWDSENKEYTHKFEDVYELYQIEGEKMFPEEASKGRRLNPIFAVRCWCTTTNREYWLYVPETEVTNMDWNGNPRKKPDAVAAIAWTIQIDISDPKRILRQGDIIIAEESDTSKTVTPYHLSKEQYLSLMYAET